MFTAYRHLAGDDIDLVFHLGDYIYEGAASTAANRPRRHLGPEITTLDDYRNRYAQYQTDPDLQAAHAAFPWIVTWDDHEVENNYAGEISEANDPRPVFLARRAAAYRAYYEHMPLRPSSMPDGPSLRLYRQFAFGDLASFFVLDTRQYRTDQPCGDRLSPPCDATVDPNATLLGRDQATWLFDGLDRSRAQWNVIPQQVMLANLDQAAGEARSVLARPLGRVRSRTPPGDAVSRRAPAGESRGAHRRHPQQLGQRSQDRLLRRTRARRRHRIRRHVDLVGRRRLGRASEHGANPRREPVREVLQLAARVRHVRRDPEGSRSDVPDRAVRHAPGRSSLYPCKVRR